MNARITLTAEHVAVLALHAGAATPLTLKELERGMGPRGLRTPAAEAQAFCVAHRLLTPGTDPAGVEYANRYVLTDAGRRAMTLSAFAAHAEIDRRIGAADRLQQDPREKERLEELRKILPPKPPAPPTEEALRGPPESDADDDAREEDGEEREEDGAVGPTQTAALARTSDDLNADIEAARKRFGRQPVSKTGRPAPRKAAARV